jgi:hypothetical protein
MKQGCCEPPWFIDINGIERLKPECLASAEQTSVKKKQGERTAAPKRSKLPAAKPAQRSKACEPPFFIDARGVMRFKPKCL